MVSAQPRYASERAPVRIVFMGTPPLAARILEILLNSPKQQWSVVAVVTRPDQPRGRGLKMESSPVASLAAAHGLPVLKPVSVKTAEFLTTLKSFEPDLLIVAGFGRIFPNEVLKAARIMPINVHTSLLPKFRGASPVEGALLAGETETGVTIMRVTERMDAGPILLQRKIPITGDDTQGSLKAKLAELGGTALLEALALLRCNQLSETPQDESLASYTAPIEKKHATIDWHHGAEQIERMVRAYDPWPVARTKLGDTELLIWRARPASGEQLQPEAEPGTLVRLRPRPVVKCGEGWLELLEVQAAGKRRMDAADFMRGRHVPQGVRLGA